MKKADIGLIGLAVMGENLVVNMESKGFTVAVFNRTTEKVDKFVNGRAAGKNIIGCHSLKELVDNLEKPRKVFMMVKAGQAVDDMIEQLLPLLPLMRPRGIVVVELFHAVELLLHQFLITRPVDFAVHHVIVHFAQWKSPLFCVYHSLSFPEYNDSTARLFFPAKMNTRQQKAASSGHS